MWFKVENKRSSAGQKFVVRCNSEIAGSRIVEERPAKGATAARRRPHVAFSSSLFSRIDSKVDGECYDERFPPV
jgi:hypothetical protein